ncbi:hypothetical protein [Streptomyces sp. NRRL F-5053]|uniref:hypothetical protein n=1 Tax=Streptomyces sp. NRRL F-5053 TaxID=1463854 RepID=UPI0004C8A1D0|nr:hypothetical protein [Streptomyces sp. NRRL F-5053]
MTESGSSSSEDIPSSGTRDQTEADDQTKRVSSEILDLIPVKGEVSKPGPRVTPCGDKDTDKFFQLLHTWTLTPEAKDRPKLAAAMKSLKKSLPEHGWEIKSFARDSSRNRNLALVADHDKKKFSVNIVHFAKDDPAKLTVRVISGCYQVPEGDEVDHY